MIEERYNDIMIVVRYREPYEYHKFDGFLDDMDFSEEDNNALSQLDMVTLFQAWLEYGSKKDFKSKPIKYMNILNN